MTRNPEEKRTGERTEKSKWKLSSFGQTLAGPSGIGELMEDLGQAAEDSRGYCMLGGGNPGLLPEIEILWQNALKSLADDPVRIQQTLGRYESPLGSPEFRKDLADLLNREYGWTLTAGHIGIVNSSQNAFFLLLNMFGGRIDGASQSAAPMKILFPLVPEYIGYADQGLDRDMFHTVRPKMTMTGKNRFKYSIDFDALPKPGGELEQYGAICLSRPTNPSGNVVTDREIALLAKMAGEAQIPLLIDNAYGLPFPGIIFTEAEPYWNPDVILSMSLSKLGLPSLRTGIIVAEPHFIKALGDVNAITSLATGAVGTALTAEMVRSGSILDVSRKIIQPYYRKRSVQVQEMIDQELREIPYRIHESEGAFFLWLWLQDLPVSSKELYQRLKEAGVLVIPGEYFFFGQDRSDWAHSRECIRLNFSQDLKQVRQGIEIIGAEVRKIYSSVRL